jgi:hypothetical protein
MYNVRQLIALVETYLLLSSFLNRTWLFGLPSTEITMVKYYFKNMYDMFLFMQGGERKVTFSLIDDGRI